MQKYKKLGTIAYISENLRTHKSKKIVFAPKTRVCVNKNCVRI